MSLYHLGVLIVGAALAATGAITGTQDTLMPMATLIVGGVFGHVGQRKN